MSVLNFKPDERNLGGKTQIYSHMINHQMTLLKMKPTINSRIRPYSSTRPTNTSLNKNSQFSEVFESFKRVATVKSNNISSCPKTFGLTSLKRNKKNNNFQMNQHELNLLSQKKKIDELNSLNLRKKNPNDPIGNPVYFFRKEDESKKDITVKGLYKRLGFSPIKENIIKHNEFAHTNKGFNSLKNKKNEEKNKIHINNYDYKFNYNRIDEKGVNKTNKFQKNIEKIDYGFIPAPDIKGNGEDAYSELKSKLLQLIIDYRIYKEKDLEDLKERTTILNYQLEAERISDIFEIIFEELEQ